MSVSKGDFKGKSNAEWQVKFAVPRSCCLALVIVGASLWSTPASWGEPSDETASAGSLENTPAIPSDLEEQIRTVFDHAKPAVVRIEADHPLGTMSGTGFFISPLGVLMTSASLAVDANSVYVTDGQARYPAIVQLIDPRSGIAILRIAKDTAHLVASNNPPTVVGTPLLSVGYPMDYPISPAFGIVAGFDTTFGERILPTTHIRAALPTQPGQAGAPVLNLKGQLVGIVVTMFANGAGCHVLPIQAAAKVYEDFLRYGRVMHGWVGVTVDEAEEPVGGSRAVIVDLVEKTPAALSGLRNGDVVLRVGKVAIRRPMDIIDASYFLTAGDDVLVGVMRDGVEMDFHVEPTYHPALARFQPVGAPAMLPSGGVILTLKPAENAPIATP